MVRKLICMLITTMLVTSAMGLTTFAQANTKDVYKEVREKLSAEFGIEVRVATDEELKKVGLTREDIEKEISKLSPADYEKELRETLKEEKEISKAAKEKAKASGITEKANISVPNTVQSESIVQPNSVSYYDVEVQNTITGGKAVLSAQIITGSTPAVKWGTVYDSWILSGALYSSAPYFVATSWSYQRLDASRTIAASYSGYTVDRYGTYIGSATRYTEFYAFNPVS